jgi:hypothetical protein
VSFSQLVLRELKLMTSNRMILTTGYAMSLVHPGYAFRSKYEGKEISLSDDEKSIL